MKIPPPTYALSILRIVSGLLFLEHGTAKLLDFPPGAAGPHPVLASLPGLGGVMELVGGALLVLGLFTRPVSFLLSGEMAVAYFMVHAHGSFYPLINKGELAVVYCFVFLYFVFSGPGIWSLDALLRRDRS